MNEFDISRIANCIEKTRQAKKHIHCLTNNVAQNFTANVLLALNSTPSMSFAKTEIKDFISQSDGVLINLGTINDERTNALDEILPMLKNKIWLLDPVMIDISQTRLELAKKLLKYNPAIVKANEAEAKVLFDKNNFENCFVESGKIDKVFFAGEKTIAIENGHQFMQHTTAIGCALGAVLASFAACEKNIRLAAISACALFAIAGEMAAQKSNGTGTFVPNFIDELQNINKKTIIEKAKIYEI